MSPSSLQKNAYESIRQMIIGNELPKGHVTSEVYLSERLGMSRTPVRSALQRLEWEGFLRIVPKQGVLIVDQSAQKVGDLIDILGSVLLFALASLRCSGNGSLSAFISNQDERFHELLLEHPDRAAETAKALCRFELDFWLGIIDLTHNIEMCRLFSQTADRLYWPNNTKRWNSLHLQTSARCFEKLLRDAPSPETQVYEAIAPYLQLLKKTWV